MSYIGSSPAEERRMLDAIGVSSVDDLIAKIPPHVRLKQPLPIPGPLSEIELRRTMGGGARENALDRSVSFLGGGVYDQ